jgi:uncharacterized membrane protein YfcA
MPALSDLPALTWVLLAIVAVIVGISKTALPGIITIGIAIMAATLPAKASTGALLLLLLIGDIFALITYRRHADWPTLVRLIPAVLVGVAFGAIFLWLADDNGVRRTIGVILLLVIAFTLIQRRRSTGAGMSARSNSIARMGYGALGGFTSLVANAGGPVISMYFLAARFQVLAFLGTAAWFFAVVNLIKLPITIGLGLVTVDTLLVVLLVAPGVLVGAFAGKFIAKRIKQQVFDWIVIGGTVIGAVYLLVG